MSERIRGFPDPFPVRSDGLRPGRYHAVSMLTRGVLRTWFGHELRFEGEANIPAQGPLLAVANHLSNIDPFLFGGFMPGTMFCMAKRELFDANPALAWVLGGCNCFPVERGAADRWALRTALDVLSGGGRLLIFVEGTRSRTARMQRVEAGIGFLARRSKAQVLPIALWGTERALARGHLLPRRTPVRVRYGTPFMPQVAAGRRPDDTAIADNIAESIAALLPPQYRGVYGVRARTA